MRRIQTFHYLCAHVERIADCPVHYIKGNLIPDDSQAFLQQE
jgi:hypothetical protein